MIVFLGLCVMGICLVAGGSAVYCLARLTGQPEHPREAWIRHVRSELRLRGICDQTSISVVRLRRGTAVRRGRDEFYELTAWADLDKVLRDHWNEQWAAVAAELEGPNAWTPAYAAARDPAFLQVRS